MATSFFVVRVPKRPLCLSNQNENNTNFTYLYINIFGVEIK